MSLDADSFSSIAVDSKLTPDCGCIRQCEHESSPPVVKASRGISSSFMPDISISPSCPYDMASLFAFMWDDEAESLVKQCRDFALRCGQKVQKIVLLPSASRTSPQRTGSNARYL